MIDHIYNKDVLKLAARISRTEEIDSPDATALVRSSMCGSSIKVSINVIQNKIVNYSQEITACALGQASASVMANVIIGKTKKEIEDGKRQTLVMLNGEEKLPEGDWKPLSALAPAKGIKSRHGAILLPFDATLEALRDLNLD